MTGSAIVLTAFLGLAGSPAHGQTADGAPVDRLVVDPERIVVAVGETVPFRVTAVDAQGNEVDAELRFTAPRTGLYIEENEVLGRSVGEYRMNVILVVPDMPAGVPTSLTPDDPPPGMPGPVPTLRIPVEVVWPELARVEITTTGAPSLYEGTTVRHRADAYHADGSPRRDPEVRWRTSDSTIATVDEFGYVDALAAGNVTITADVDGVQGSTEHEVRPFAGERIEIAGGAARVRTGDVVDFDASVFDTGGQISDIPVNWTYHFTPDDTAFARGAAAEIEDGRFVAEVPGTYSVLAQAGPLTARNTVKVESRRVVQRVHEIGRGPVRHASTSDLWVFEGRDGRDYAITGTHGAGGTAYIWDISDPANIAKTDSVQVDARNINDVKVSPDARYAVMSREGASDRRNGVVILDLANPRHPIIASEFSENLTGGVHNVHPTEDYLFALSGGQKYVAIDVRDIFNPRYVSEYNHPNSRIHDVWVEDGIAFSSEWENGIVVVDYGNGRWGGTVENPVHVTTIQLPGMLTHTVFPYKQASTGKYYLFATDEIWPRAGGPLEGFHEPPFDPETGEGGRPTQTDGFLQVIDFTDPENPAMVARYDMAEYGTHNPWVEDDILYIGHYEGGMRVVDVSGQLKGDLKRQGREIAVFKPYDPHGFRANAPMVWSAMPHKGHIFLADANSGLWSTRLDPPRISRED